MIRYYIVVVDGNKYLDGNGVLESNEIYAWKDASRSHMEWAAEEMRKEGHSAVVVEKVAPGNTIPRNHFRING